MEEGVFQGTVNIIICAIDYVREASRQDKIMAIAPGISPSQFGEVAAFVLSFSTFSIHGSKGSANSDM